MDVIENAKLKDNATKVGDYCINRLNSLKEKHPIIGDIRWEYLRVITLYKVLFKVRYCNHFLINKFILLDISIWVKSLPFQFFVCVHSFILDGIHLFEIEVLPPKMVTLKEISV